MRTRQLSAFSTTKLRIIIRGRNGRPKFVGNVKGDMKYLPHETSPEGYNLNAAEAQRIPGSLFKSPVDLLIFDEGNPNPLPFTGELPNMVIVGADGKPVRAVQMGIIAGPMLPKIIRDGLNSRKTPFDMDWKILIIIGVALIAAAFAIGHTYQGKLW